MSFSSLIMTSYPYQPIADSSLISYSYDIKVQYQYVQTVLDTIYICKMGLTAYLIIELSCSFLSPGSLLSLPAYTWTTWTIVSNHQNLSTSSLRVPALLGLYSWYSKQMWGGTSLHYGKSVRKLTKLKLNEIMLYLTQVEADIDLKSQGRRVLKGGLWEVKDVRGFRDNS